MITGNLSSFVVGLRAKMWLMASFRSQLNFSVMSKPKGSTSLLNLTLMIKQSHLFGDSMWFSCYLEVLQLVTGMQLRWTLNTFLHDNLSMFASLWTPRSIPITQWQWDKERVQRLFSRVIISMSAPPNTLAYLGLIFPKISAMLSSFELLF